MSVAAADHLLGTGLPRDWGRVMQELMGLRAELMDDRRVLRNVGGNLNDVARSANSDGVVPDETARVLGMVDRAVERIDETVAELSRQVATARTALLRAAR